MFTSHSLCESGAQACLSWALCFGGITGCSQLGWAVVILKLNLERIYFQAHRVVGTILFPVGFWTEGLRSWLADGWIVSTWVSSGRQLASSSCLSQKDNRVRWQDRKRSLLCKIMKRCPFNISLLSIFVPYVFPFNSDYTELPLLSSLFSSRAKNKCCHGNQDDTCSHSWHSLLGYIHFSVV